MKQLYELPQTSKWEGPIPEAGICGGTREPLRKTAQATQSHFRNDGTTQKWTSPEDGKIGKLRAKRKNDGRKNNIKCEKATFENFEIKETKENKKKYSSQSTIGIPSKKIKKEIDRECRETWNIK